VIWFGAGGPGAGGPLAGQAPDRLWGEVVTAAGERHVGYLRWDRNETGWMDLLEGRRRLDAEIQDRVAVALGGTPEERARSVEFMGVRISWDEDDPPGAGAAGVRFGQLREVRRLGEDRALLVLRDGSEVEFTSASTDLGSGHRGLRVTPVAGAPTELRWRDLDRVRFGAVPADAPDPDAFRLHGTVEDRWGRRWTGDISWDRDEALSSDLLEGEEGGEERAIRFELVASIARRAEGGARIRLRNGREMILEGSNDVDRGHRGVQVSDPELGQIDVPWTSFARVRFHPPASRRGYDAFPVAGALYGTVVDRSGERHEGRIIWDADEAAEWEMLNGNDRGLAVQVAFGRIRAVERASARSARVELRDGRVLELEGSNDVGRGNRGIVVEGADGTLRVVTWRDFVRLDVQGGR
jgi:hypothetical protein